ncbi:MAG: hypothetical protein ACC742_13820 [Thermoanaerobaculales bacterium]
MRNALKAGVHFAGTAFLCAGVSASPADRAQTTCTVDALSLAKPAYMVVDAVVRGNRLLLPDYTNGLREIDLTNGKDLRSVLPMGIDRGQVAGPQHLGCGPERCVVWGSRYFWLYFDPGWKLLDEYAARQSSPAGQPLVFDDRMVVFGIARAEIAGGGTPYLYVQYDDGAIVPLQEFQPSMPIQDIVKRIHFQGITTGGLAALPGGGWAFVDPRSYAVFIFDKRDRLVRAWHGANPSFRSPNWSAYTIVHDASGRQSFSRWQLAQPLVKRPVVLGDDLMGIVVGLPDGVLRQRHVLDLYRLDGEPVALGVPIPGVTAGRLIVADADDRRLVLVGQESWAPSAATTVWEVKVPELKSLHKE